MGRGRHFAAVTAARIGEVSGCRVGDINADTWHWTVRRQTTPSPGGLMPVPDSDILAWLRHHTDTTGHVPGRRQMIEKWALGSTRAERLRAIVIKEAGNTPAPAG
jgi:hypothetical protein